MSPHPARRPPQPTPVEILDRPRGPAQEALIERITISGDRVEVALLRDGAAARLGRDEADWLELRPGDIVPVRPRPAAVSE